MTLQFYFWAYIRRNQKKNQKTKNTYLDVLICILAFFVIFWAADTLAFSAK